MSCDLSPPPALESRFVCPEGWRWHVFTNPQGRKLRFGSVYPPGRIASAVIVMLPGLSEFSEKYFELGREFSARNLAMWVLDWQGQGLSHRHLKNPEKRYSEGFGQDVADLHYFIMEYVKHSAVHPDVGRIPLVLLGHSMGGSVGLHYLHDHPDMFACAAFTAPLFGIPALRLLPPALSCAISFVAKEGLDQTYVPGHGDWKTGLRESAPEMFSHDPVRRKVHDAWCTAHPALRVGGVTYQWLHQALKSCNVLNKRAYLRTIQTPCLFGIAGRDRIIDNARARQAIAHLPQSQTIELPESAHEIFMETDLVRGAFLEAFYAFLKTHVLDNPEGLKRF